MLQERYTFEPIETISEKNTIYDNPILDLRKNIPKGYDITGIHVEFPENIEKILIYFYESPSRSIIFDKDMVDYMRTFPFYLSLCSYMKVEIRFLYNEEWFNNRGEFELVDEYKDKDILSDELVTIWDGYEYHSGQIVEGIEQVKTGKQVLVCKKPVNVSTPRITLDIAKINHEHINKYQTVLQKLKYNELSNDLIERYISKYNFSKIDDVFGYIENQIQYICGLVGLKFIF